MNVVPVLLVVFVYFQPGSQFRIAAFPDARRLFRLPDGGVRRIAYAVEGMETRWPWTLGRFGFVINIAALVYGVLAMLVLAKPSSDAGLAFYDRWIALIGFLVVAGVGLAYLLIAKPERNSTAPEGDAMEVAERLRSSRRALTDDHMSVDATPRIAGLPAREVGDGVSTWSSSARTRRTTASTPRISVRWRNPSRSSSSPRAR